MTETTVLTPDQLQAKLKNLSADVVPQVKKVMGAGCRVVVKEAKLNCTPGQSPYDGMFFPTKQDPTSGAPFDTGRLRASITAKVESDERSVKGIVGTNVEYALYVHEGTSKMQQRPFILDAIIAKTPEVQQIIRAGVINAMLAACDTPVDTTYMGVTFAEADSE